MRILVSGGGTAGHVSPVLATVAALRQHDSQLEVRFVGQLGGMERDLVRRAGLGFIGILGGKYRRVAGQRWWASPWDLLLNLRDLVLIAVGALQSLWILGRFHPDVIFNKGGTVGLPIGLAAHILRIPMVIHEPDVEPGIGNRILSRWARSIAVGFPVEHYRSFPKAKLSFTGNPVQPAIFAGSATRFRAATGFSGGRPVALVVGGSQGAMRLNSALIKVLPQLLGQTQIYHITGAYDLDRVATNAHQSSLSQSNGYRYDPFLPTEQMADAYAVADVVVARAGANTIAELAALKKPVVLVPNRQAAAHQLRNAAVLEKAQAAIVVDERSGQLLDAVSELIRSQPHRRRLSKAIATFSAPNAAERIAQLLIKAGAWR